MSGETLTSGGALRLAYLGALSVSALCVLTVIWRFGFGDGGPEGGMQGLAGVALLLCVPMAPGTFTLFGAGVMSAYGIGASNPYRWIAIIGATWTMFITWSFLTL